MVLKKGEDFLKEFNTEGKIDEFVNKNGNVKKIELDASDLKQKFLVFVILLYPFYLVIRFISWAIRTLKPKSES